MILGYTITIRGCPVVIDGSRFIRWIAVIDRPYEEAALLLDCARTLPVDPAGFS